MLGGFRFEFYFKRGKELWALSRVTVLASFGDKN